MMDTVEKLRRVFLLDFPSLYTKRHDVQVKFHISVRFTLALLETHVGFDFYEDQYPILSFLWRSFI